MRKANNKFIFLFFSAAFAIGAIFFGWQYSKSKAPVEDEGVTSKTQETQKDSKLSVDDLFFDNQYIFLNADISDSYIEEVRKNVGEKDSEKIELINKAVAKWTILKKVNQFFSQSALVGNQINESATLTAEIGSETKQEIKELLAGSNIQDGFSEKINQIINGDNQLAGTIESSTSESSTTHTQESDNKSVDSEDARVKLAVIVSDGHVVEGFTKEGYTNARDAIALLSEGTEKKLLQAELKLVENAMTSMGIPF